MSITSKATCAVLLLACSLLGGCQLLGAVVAKAQGSPPIPAQYVPPKVPTLILAEHGAQAGIDDIDAEDIGRRTADTWEDQKKLAPLVDLAKLERLRLSDPAKYRSMSTAAIGEAVGAKQVVYVDVRNSRIEAAGGSDTIRAVASARVRVVDVASGRTLWPTDAASGYSVDAQTQYQARGDGVSESTQMEQVRAIIADRIVKLFYEHQPDEGEQGPP